MSAAIAFCAAWSLWKTPATAPTQKAVAADAEQGAPIDPSNVTTPSRAVSHPGVASTAALPAKGTPLKQIFADLKSRADAGDAAAASRLFNDVSRCHYAQSVNTDVAGIAKIALGENTSGMTAQQIESEEQMLEALQRQLAGVKESQALCDGIGRAELQQLVPVTLRAAQLGDNAAAECYVNGRALMGDGILDHPEWLTQYKQNALAIAEQAIARGDGTMARELEGAYGNRFNLHNLAPLAQVTGYDVAKQYRYFSLGRLGGAPFDGDMNQLMPGLSADDIAAGDAWARDTFQRYFSAQPDSRIAQENSCEGSSD